MNPLNVSHINSMFDFALVFALLALSAYRLTILLVDDDGPFGVLFTLRTLAGAYDYDENGQVKSELGKLFRCPYCMGVWISFVMMLALLFLPFGLLWAPIVLFALAGVQYLLQAHTDFFFPKNR